MGNFMIGKANGFITTGAMKMNVQVLINFTVTSGFTERIFWYSRSIVYLVHDSARFKGLYGTGQCYSISLYKGVLNLGQRYGPFLFGHKPVDQDTHRRGAHLVVI
jgi:hypothetical protein